MDIKDNILGPALFEKVQSVVLNKNIPYYYNDSTAYTDREAAHVQDFSFSHLVYQQGDTFSNLSPLLESACMTALDNAKERCKEILRIRLGLITATTETVVHTPHVDFEMPHKSALLYINNADGDTVFYNEVFTPGEMHSGDFLKNNNLTVYNTVSPKANRFVCFNGLRYHSSSTPTQTSRRVVINFNYV